MGWALETTDSCIGAEEGEGLGEKAEMNKTVVCTSSHRQPLGIEDGFIALYGIVLHT